jgi:predicted nucleic acid-binding protein
MILDTSFVVDLFREQERAFQRGVELAEQDDQQFLPSVVLEELEHGVFVLDLDEDRRRRVRNAARLYPTVDVDTTVARRAGQLLGEADVQHGGAGEAGIDKIDPLVAAVADLQDDAVLTDNVDHFEMLGVPVETY